ncbi:MAG: hypothetical protein IJJ33_11590 [Victivallales bacterium]|nr:hypothetical protein [Victivallales bacterium]
MKNNLLLPLGILILCALSGWAQIGMQLSAEHDCFLRYEPIHLKLVLRNYSGNTLLFSADDLSQGRLVFKITGTGGRLISQIDPRANPMGGLVFAPGDSKELNLTLNTLYDLQRDDTYTVTAYIEHKRLPQAFVSNSVTLEVREGTILTSKTVGLPTPRDNDLIRSITASLMRFTDGHGELYCLRIEDAENVYGTFRVGPYIHGSKPQLDADGSSAIHVLVQVRPRLYCYTVYSVIDGEAKQRQRRYYVPENGVPQLSRATGYLKILYARQANEGVDFRFQEENWKPRYSQP